MLFFKDRASTAWAASDAKTYLEQYYFIVFYSLLSREKCPSYAIIVGTMDVFISWSGERSRAVAEALRDWLPMIINAMKPFLSANDIHKGMRWASELALKLQTAKAGIICLTSSNVHSDWILFEAGALSKTLERTYVCPFLIDLEPSEVKGPLAQFQATKSTKNEILKLIKILNSALGDFALSAEHIDKAFEVWWPKLHAQLGNLPPDGPAGRPSRNERDLLEEILGLVRNQSRSLSADSFILSDEDRKEIIEGRIKLAIKSIDPSAGGFISTSMSGKNINMTLDGKKKYSVIMPVRCKS